MASTDLEQRSTAQEIAEQIRGEEFRQQLAAALPEGISVDRFARVTVTALMEDASKQSDPAKQLIAADRASLYQAVIKCAQDGLLPDGREAALVKRGSKVAYQPMVGGFRKIGAEHGWTIRSHAVFENDEFAYTVQPPTITHRPVQVGEERGKLVAAYAVATHRDGRREQVVLHPEEIAKRRAQATTQQVWNQWEPQQWEKTAARDLFAELPMDPADRDRIARVIEASQLAPGEAAALLYSKSSPGNGEAADRPAASLPSADGTAVGSQQAGGAPSPEASPAPGADDDFGGEDEVDPDVAAAQAASTFEVTVPKKENWVNGLTLAQINARGDDGEKFFRWALGRANHNDQLRAEASAYAKVQLPALWAELAEVDS